MKFLNIKKLINCTLIMTACFCAQDSLDAAPMLFKAGDSASYIVTQKVDMDVNQVGVSEHTQSEATIDFDVRILSCNPETQSFPFEVEVHVKHIQMNETQTEVVVTSGEPIVNTLEISVDSDESSKKAKNCSPGKYLTKLTNEKLTFIVDKSFNVKETTGLLKKAYNNIECESEMGIFGTSPWHFKVLLTQLFHLAGQEDIAPSGSYKVSCGKLASLANWENEKEKPLFRSKSSHYTVNEIDSGKIAATWTGEAQLEDCNLEGNFFTSTIMTLEGDVKWDMTNLLRQQRNMKIQITEMDSQQHPITKALIEQAWQVQ